VNKKLSPIISKDSFYHIFQLTKIIVPENENLAGIKERKIRELRDTPDELLSLILQRNANSQTP